jgi:hypothetical protein
MHIDERRLYRLFRDRGFEVHEARRNRHWWVRIARVGGGPEFFVSVAQTPSDFRFERSFDTALKRAERAAASRM